jgi:hypothetical protein
MSRNKFPSSRKGTTSSRAHKILSPKLHQRIVGNFGSPHDKAYSAACKRNAMRHKWYKRDVRKRREAAAMDWLRNLEPTIPEEK